MPVAPQIAAAGMAVSRIGRNLESTGTGMEQAGIRAGETYRSGAWRRPGGGRAEGSGAPGGRRSKARAAPRDGETRPQQAVDIGSPKEAISTGSIDLAADPWRRPEHPKERSSDFGSGRPDEPSGRAPITGRASADVHVKVVFQKPF